MMRMAVPAAIDPAALAGWDSGAAIVELAGSTMGTGWRVRAAAPKGFDGTGLRDAIQALLDRLVAEMSHWEAGSTLSRFNAAPAGNWMTLPPDFAAVMAAGLDVAAQSDGAFDPAIGALVDIWGFGPVPAVGPPDEGTVQAALAQGGWRRLAYDPESRCLRQPGGLRLDLSGIAKGHAVDRLANLLVRMGVRHCLVDVGGELAGLGMRPDGDPWWVDLETPGGVAPPLRVALHQLAVATSGDYVRGRHSIDPRSGRPVEHMLAVSVLHASAMLADAWATALGVVDPGMMATLARRHRLAVRALLRQGEDIAEWISPALAAMMSDDPGRTAA